MKPQVVVVGSFVQDLSFRCAAFPQAGETVVGEFFTGPGGKGSNQAIACGRTGVATLYVGAVGDDAFGRDAAAFYRAEKIGAKFAIKPKHPTGSAGILINKTGQNEIIVALGANAFLQKRDIPLDELENAKVVVCQLESNLETNAFVLKRARRAGVMTVLNTAPMRPDFDPGVLRDVDVLIPNETEFVTLAQRLPALKARGLSPEKLVALSGDAIHLMVRKLGIPTVIVTLGSRGCFVSTTRGFEHIPAHKGIKVVDTTGAGDAFVGGFAAGLVKFGGEIGHAARYGNAVAALSVTKPGTAPSMPRATELARFLKR